MGSSISAIYDDYETYECLCQMRDIVPVSIRDEKSFYDHAREIITTFSKEEHEKFKTFYWYNKLK